MFCGSLFCRRPGAAAAVLTLIQDACVCGGKGGTNRVHMALSYTEKPIQKVTQKKLCSRSKQQSAWRGTKVGG